jgi:hypothetical protein
MKKILQKPMLKRTEEDLDELVGFIKDISFFKERANLKINDIRELAACFKFVEVSECLDVIKYGEIGENFYLILQGLVSVQIKNEKISDWGV